MDIPAELERREDRLKAIAEARAKLEARAPPAKGPRLGPPVEGSGCAGIADIRRR